MTTLERTLAKAPTEIVIRRGLSDDDAITPGATTEVLQPDDHSCRTSPSRNGKPSPN